MKYCTSCGKRLVDTSTFCVKCGQPAATADTTTVRTESAARSPRSQMPKKSGGRLFLGLGFAVAIIGGCAGYILLHNPTPVSQPAPVGTTAHTAGPTVSVPPSSKPRIASPTPTVQVSTPDVQERDPNSQALDAAAPSSYQQMMCTSGFQPAQTVRAGSDTAEILAVQWGLNRIGFHTELNGTKALPVDGTYGPVTADAVGRFQGGHKLTKTGMADTKTWSEITRELNRREVC